MAKSPIERTILARGLMARNVLANSYITVTELLCLLPGDLSARDQVLTFLLDQMCGPEGAKDEAALVDAAIREFARGFSTSN